MLRVRVTPEFLTRLFTDRHGFDYVTVSKGLPDGAILHSIGFDQDSEAVELFFYHHTSPEINKYQDCKVEMIKVCKELDA